MADVWNRATAGMIERNKADIARQSLSHWRRYAQEVHCMGGNVMNRNIRNIINTVLLVFIVFMFAVRSVGKIDPGLSTMMLMYTDKAKKQYNAQLETMGAETAGHIWLNDEVKATKDYQKQFDEYLSTFRGIISYAAQIYGFYYEINNLTENMQKLSHQIGDTPVNAVAVALHRNRNDIYVDIINRSVAS
jgi:hypothetical protein